MHAVVRRYQATPQLLDELERRHEEVERLIGSVPGFLAYYLIRDGDGGASITVCQDQAGTRESTRLAAAWVKENLPSAAGRPPEVTEGPVTIHKSS